MTKREKTPLLMGGKEMSGEDGGEEQEGDTV